MTFTKEEIEIMKQAVKEYNYISRYINYEIKNGASMEQLLEYVVDEFDADITNYDLLSDYKYIDFNYGCMNCSIIQSKELPTHLSDTIELWNDEDNYMITSSITIKEIKQIIKENNNETMAL